MRRALEWLMLDQVWITKKMYFFLPCFSVELVVRIDVLFIPNEILYSSCSRLSSSENFGVKKQSSDVLEMGPLRKAQALFFFSLIFMLILSMRLLETDCVPAFSLGV